MERGSPLLFVRGDARAKSNRSREVRRSVAVEGGSQTVWEGWPAAAVQIQCFSFDSRGKVAG
jgi:hypothetical protein